MGSGPNAPDAQSWDAGLFHARLAINNAWRVRPDWTHLIHPEDFPSDRHPPEFLNTQTRVTYRDYVPAQNAMGGFVYAGGTMAFTAAYWALHHFKPDVIGFIGCDMTYAASGDTHFYGKGEADPLRKDVTLQNLTAKSARFACFAAQAGCRVVNYSKDESRLMFPRSTPGHKADPIWIDRAALRGALEREAELGYFEPSGRYWEIQDRFDSQALRELDEMWLRVVV